MKNLCLFTGNITHDIELRHTPNGKAVTEFSIAVNKRLGKDDDGNIKEQVSFFNMVAWEDVAERIAKFFKKGYPIEVQCEAFVDSWEDKISGEKKSRVKFNVRFWEFTLPSKKKDENEDDEENDDEEEEVVAPVKKKVDSKPAAKPATKPASKQTPKKPAKGEDLDDTDDNIDF